MARLEVPSDALHEIALGVGRLIDQSNTAPPPPAGPTADDVGAGNFGLEAAEPAEAKLTIGKTLELWELKRGALDALKVRRL